MRLLLLCSAVFLFTAGMSCRKSKNNNPPAHYGKVISAMCGHITVQLTDGSPYGQNGWVSPNLSYSVPYDHVFRVANPCTWGGPAANNYIKFRFVPPAPQSCVQCMAWAPTPDTAYSIEVLQ